MSGAIIVDEKFCFKVETELTVHKTSVFFPGDAFLVYNSDGQIVFRFDSYGSDSESKDELVLMDATGKCLLSLLRKKPSLHQRWDGYLGEIKEDNHQDPVFKASRSSIIGRSNLMVHVFGDPGDEYQIEGSYARRRCVMYNTSLDSLSKDCVAEIKRKVDPTTNVMLSKDVFWLCVKPGVDSAFAMGLVLVLDQIYGDNDDSDQPDVDLTSEDVSSST
ncbi:protein LURP-one-related 5-like [Mercurialis annua]|uniref:protein LURP-one-related 5-like n=1 Tax=Mercurialis annua TaxID=3986 RepID=UPI002160BC01|nr:protein LURP-one-related 5-like [Mercurialis annua]